MGFNLNFTVVKLAPIYQHKSVPIMSWSPVRWGCVPLWMPVRVRWWVASPAHARPPQSGWRERCWLCIVAPPGRRALSSASRVHCSGRPTANTTPLILLCFKFYLKCMFQNKIISNSFYNNYRKYMLVFVFLNSRFKGSSVPQLYRTKIVSICSRKITQYVSCAQTELQ